METLTMLGNKELWDLTISFFETDKDQCGDKSWIVKMETTSLEEL